MIATVAYLVFILLLGFRGLGLYLFFSRYPLSKRCNVKKTFSSAKVTRVWSLMHIHKW